MGFNSGTDEQRCLCCCGRLFYAIPTSRFSSPRSQAQHQEQTCRVAPVIPCSSPRVLPQLPRSTHGHTPLSEARSAKGTQPWASLLWALHLLPPRSLTAPRGSRTTHTPALTSFPGTWWRNKVQWQKGKRMGQLERQRDRQPNLVYLQQLTESETYLSSYLYRKSGNFHMEISHFQSIRGFFPIVLYILKIILLPAFPL